MKITAKIAAAGDSSISRFPVPGEDLEDLVTVDGHFDEAKAIRALSGIPGVQLGSGDEAPALAFGIEFLKQLEAVVGKLAADPNRDCHLNGKTKKDARCQRNLDKGRVVYATVRVSSRAPALSASGRVIPSIGVKVDVDNPLDTVGAAESFAADFALLSAKIVNYLCKIMGERIKIFRVPGEHIEGNIFELAERDDRFWDRQKAEKERLEYLKKKRVSCSRRCGEYCSPSCPDCTMYLNGRCVEPVEDLMYSDENRVKVELKK